MSEAPIRPILLIATGGTIASSQTDDGVRVVYEGADLVARLPDGTAELVDVEDVERVASWNLTPTAMAKTVERARRAVVDDGHQGVVITHGTDTIEETGFLAWLLADAAAEVGPIVFTCSMRHADEAGTDASRNLADAVAVARSPRAIGLGPVLVANGEIHSTRWVTKTSSVGLSTFVSPGVGALGSVESGVVRIRHLSPRPRTLPTGIDERVAYVKANSLLDPSVLRAQVPREMRAVVIEGTGSGNLPGQLGSTIADLVADGLPVVVTTRCQQGPVVPLYGGPGGGATLERLGVIAAGDLPGSRAWLATMAALGSGYRSASGVASFLHAL